MAFNARDDDLNTDVTTRTVYTAYWPRNEDTIKDGWSAGPVGWLTICTSPVASSAAASLRSSATMMDAAGD